MEQELVAWVEVVRPDVPEGSRRCEIRSATSTPDGEVQFAELLDFLTKDAAARKGDAGPRQDKSSRRLNA